MVALARKITRDPRQHISQVANTVTHPAGSHAPAPVESRLRPIRSPAPHAASSRVLHHLPCLALRELGGTSLGSARRKDQPATQPVYKRRSNLQQVSIEPVEHICANELSNTAARSLNRDACRSVPYSSTTLRMPAQTQKERGQEPFRDPDLLPLSCPNHSLWAKGDLNPHVPKDTGT